MKQPHFHASALFTSFLHVEKQASSRLQFGLQPTANKG